MARSQAISTAEHQAAKERIETILSGAYRLPEKSASFACPIEALCIAPDLSDQARDLLDALNLSGRLALVSDPNTFDALGQQINRKLSNADLVVIDKPMADDANIALLTDQTRHADLLIAVGSGTLNDLCKYVSHQRSRPYVVFPTAPSMNGYTTATASISRDGEKLSLPAKPPIGIFFDLTVLACAPRRLIQAGVGDSLCRSTAQADWMLSLRLHDTAYMTTPFHLQAEAEAELLRRAGELQDQDLDAMKSLVHLLVLGGLGMLMAGTSQPGSQGEHLISHYIDMACRPHPGTLHGEQVGLATWTMANLQQDMLMRRSPPVLEEAALERGSSAAQYAALKDSCSETGTMPGRQLDVLNGRLEQLWPSIRADLNDVALPLEDLETAFAAAGVAMDAEALGIDRQFYRDAVRNAGQLRDRFTMLDFASDTANLEPFIDRHFTL